MLHVARQADGDFRRTIQAVNELGVGRILQPNAELPDGREILDLHELVSSGQDVREQGAEVQPLVGRALEVAVVEVEAIDVDDGAHSGPLKKQGPISGACTLRTKP